MTDDIDRRAQAIQAIEVADDYLVRSKRRLRTIAIVCAVLFAVAAYVGFTLAMACFVALPLLLLRWQRAKDTHAAAIARAEASAD